MLLILMLLLFLTKFFSGFFVGYSLISMNLIIMFDGVFFSYSLLLILNLTYVMGYILMPLKMFFLNRNALGLKFSLLFLGYSVYYEFVMSYQQGFSHNIKLWSLN